MPDEVNPQLSSEVKRVLTEHGDGFRPLSLTKAAKTAGLSVATMHSLEKGKRVDIMSVLRFASAFGEDAKAWVILNGDADFVPLLEQLQAGQKKHEFDVMLEEVPIPSRREAREDLRRLIKGYIIPRYNAAA